jgi:hypothetical protein
MQKTISVVAFIVAFSELAYAAPKTPIVVIEKNEAYAREGLHNTRRNGC